MNYKVRLIWILCFDEKCIPCVYWWIYWHTPLDSHQIHQRNFIEMIKKYRKSMSISWFSADEYRWSDSIAVRLKTSSVSYGLHCTQHLWRGPQYWMWFLPWDAHPVACRTDIVSAQRYLLATNHSMTTSNACFYFSFFSIGGSFTLQIEIAFRQFSNVICCVWSFNLCAIHFDVCIHLTRTIHIYSRTRTYSGEYK